MDAEDRTRTASHKTKVLARLRTGRPATNHELRSIGGSRAMARVHELQHEGFAIKVTKADRSTWTVQLLSAVPVPRAPEPQDQSLF